MKDLLCEVKSPLFDGISPEERKTMLGCIGYHIGNYKKGDIVAFEDENIRLGPTLPAFVSPNVLNFLVEKFNIAPITTPEEDIKAILG